MNITAVIILIGLLLITAVEYACLVASKQADEQAERIHKKFEEKQNE